MIEPEYIESTDDGQYVYTGESFSDVYDDPIKWGKLEKIVKLTDWFIDGKSSAPSNNFVMDVLETLSEEYGLTLSVRVNQYPSGEKELTLMGIYIEEDIEVGEEYAEVRQYIVDRFGNNQPFYRIDLSGEIVKTGS